MAGRIGVRVGALAVGVVASGLLLVGCDSSTTTPTTVAPTEFIPSQSSGWSSGYETFCDHGNRVYSSITSGGGLAVAPGDPSCKTP